MHKILAKDLTSRSRKVLRKVVGRNQHAFIIGRQILEAPLITNECIDSYTKSENSIILCKLDIENAYDPDYWSFLLTILKKMGFPSKWRNWISFCIFTICFSILINGDASSSFSSSTGLRQGDLLSPLLLILVMVSVIRLVNKAIEEGFLDGFHISAHASRVC